MGFFNEQSELITNFLIFPCETEKIFVNGLKQGEKLISYEPFIIFNDNSAAIGLNESFHQFYHIDAEGNTLNTINITFSDQCDLEDTFIVEEALESSELIEYQPKFIFLGLGLVLVVFIFILKKVIYENPH